ncbi:hypothetical protein K7G98_14150, partial [Saccharothrix sp. MB29]|nr:hypothetical protein [Saccharothrix sp. MB29]
MLDDVATTVAKEKAPLIRRRRRRTEGARGRCRGAAAGRRGAFSGRWSRNGRTSTAGTRPPTRRTVGLAGVAATALDTAGIRERVAVKSASEVPPGRLRMRGVRAAEAQRAAGASVTAQPFTRITRTQVPTPPLRLGVACDVSGTMGWARDHVASAAWILADAARHTRVPAQTASVIFGRHVRPLTRPGKPPAEVTEFHSNDNWEDIPTALDALDSA